MNNKQETPRENRNGSHRRDNRNNSGKRFPHRRNNSSSRSRRPTSEKPSERTHLKVCTLSGTNEIGRNSNIIEYGNDMLVIDFGLSFPGDELLGVDYTIPSFKYLIKNKKRIKGILITHGHLDHTGGLPYILEKLDFPPIYAGRFASALIKERLKEFKLDKKAIIHDVHRNKELSLGAFNIKFIGVTHSIPNSFGIHVKSPKGAVFFTGDYKMDPTPANEHPTDKASLKQIAGTVDLALMESTNPETEGKARSDKVVAENLEKYIANHDGRVVVAAFASLVSRLYSVIQIAQKHNRKVFISGRSLHTAVRIAREQRYIEFPENLLVAEEKVSQYPAEQVLVMCTGSQGERYAALNRMSLGEHKYVKPKPGDRFILSASEIPGNESAIERMTDRLLTKGIELIQSNIADVHGSGHGLQEDMREMYEVLRPKAVMPNHGGLTKRYKNRNNLIKWGANPDKVFLTEDGAFWTFYPSTNTWKRTHTIESKPIMIDGLGVGDISEIVLKDRKQLSQYGMVTVILNLSSKSKAMISKPKFISRGFVYVKHSWDLINELEKLVKDEHNKWLANSHKQKRFEQKDLTRAIEKTLRRYIYKKIEREPMILPVII